MLNFITACNIRYLPHHPHRKKRQREGKSIARERDKKKNKERKKARSTRGYILDSSGSS
jgi:hypothetical protein